MHFGVGRRFLGVALSVYSFLRYFLYRSVHNPAIRLNIEGAKGREAKNW